MLDQKGNIYKIDKISVERNNGIYIDIFAEELLEK